MTDELTLFKGGLVVDGIGKTPHVEDLLVDSDRIVAREPSIDLRSNVRKVAANGFVVCPGFIDLHSHADFSLLAFPTADSAIRQGITTVATGNCGGGVAPIRNPDEVGTTSFAHDPKWEVTVDWANFAEYTSRLHGAAINVAPLVAHGPIRNHTIGMQPRHTTNEENHIMRNLLAECLEQGAFGMSTGLEYQPGMWTDPTELASLVEVVGQYGRLYATHMRGRAHEHGQATREALDTADRNGARLQLSHFAPRPNAPSHVKDEAFRQVARAVSNGKPVGIDTFPEVWGPALLIDLFPEWSLEGTVSEAMQRLGSSDVRDRIAEHFEETPSFLAKVAGYSEIYIADSPTRSDLTGISITDLAGGRSIGTVCCDLLAEAGAEFRSIAIRHIYATENDLSRTIELPYCSIESDGVVTKGEGRDNPLTWSASSYGYVARVLEHYVREIGALRLEEAIRKMTSLPAKSLGLDRRGSLEVGNFADIVVFDANAIHDRSTPDDPSRHPTGFKLVMVNGVIAVENDAQQAVLSGRLLAPL